MPSRKALTLAQILAHRVADSVLLKLSCAAVGSFTRPLKSNFRRYSETKRRRTRTYGVSGAL